MSPKTHLITRLEDLNLHRNREGGCVEFTRFFIRTYNKTKRFKSIYGFKALKT